MNNSKIESVVERVSEWSKQQLYLGYNKHDGLNSPVLNALLGWSKWSRIIAIQIVMRAPINLRPFFLIRKTYNPKGLALYVQGYLDRYKATNDNAYLIEARSLLDKLVKYRTQGAWKGNAWGYLYPWQDPGFFSPSGMPNAVVTSFVCEAFLDAYLITKDKDYLQVVADAIPFYLKDLPILKESEDEMCLGYMPVKMSMRVMDVSILIGAVISRYATIIDDKKILIIGKRLVRYVINQQTDSRIIERRLTISFTKGKNHMLR